MAWAAGPGASGASYSGTGPGPSGLGTPSLSGSCGGAGWPGPTANEPGRGCLCSFSPLLRASPPPPGPTTVSTAGGLCLACSLRGCRDRAGAGRGCGSPTLGASRAWLPGLRDKQGRTQAREGGRGQAGEQVCQELCGYKGPLVSPSLGWGGGPLSLPLSGQRLGQPGVLPWQFVFLS